MKSNLYAVYCNDYDYAYFVFAQNPNRAKSLCVYLNSDSEEYTSLRCITLKANIENCPYNDKAIDSPDDKEYEYVKKLGFGWEQSDEEE